MGRRILFMSSWFFQDMLNSGEHHYTIKEGLPKDVRIVKVSMDVGFIRDQVAFMLESAEWPEMSEGQTIPTFDVTIATIQPKQEPASEPATRFREFT
jgi:hypothetical protein